MKIQDAYLTGAAASELTRAQQTQAVTPVPTEAARKPPASASDSVGLSALSVRLLEVARGQSPEQVARLERLAAEIRTGRYRVDPLELSRRLIEEAMAGPS